MNVLNMTVLAATALAAFLLTALLGKKLIPVLHRLKFGQTIRDIGPAWHKNKQGTPTMGGILFIIGTLAAFAAALFVCEMWVPLEWPILDAPPATLTRLFSGVILALCCGAVGFLDDYIKVVKKRNLGLTEKQKLFGQLLVSLGYALSVYMAQGTAIHIPFFGDVELGVWFIPLCMFVILSETNAVNFTDGIDGLCGTVSFVVTLFFLIVAGATGYFGQSLLAAALGGALVGFLVWNLHPAKVFMGDTGSLFIGGAICALAFGIGRPLLLLPAGIVYLIEMLSVVLQVTYFKLTHGKRLFKMSPLHHHFEMSGWSENKIVTVFTLLTIAGGAVGMLFVLYA